MMETPDPEKDPEILMDEQFQLEVQIVALRGAVDRTQTVIDYMEMRSIEIQKALIVHLAKTGRDRSDKPE